MGNEVVIEVTATDGTGPVKDELKASWKAFEKSFTPLGLTATNPINAAFVAQVKASIKSLSQQALEIPVNADTAPFVEQLDATIAELSGITQADIPVEIANAAEYRAAVQELVAQTSAEVKEVITVEADPASLAALKITTAQAAEEAAAAASAAASAETKAQQELAAAQEAANAEPTTKSQLALAAAEEEAASAGQANAKAQAMLAEAQAAAAEASQVLADSENAAAAAGRGMGAAMGPLWMLMNVAQIAMFAFGTSSSSTATKVQDASQQIIQLGQVTGTTAQSLVGGNQNLQKMQDALSGAGSTANQFGQAFSGSMATATQYTKGLEAAQASLGARMLDGSKIYTNGMGLADQSGKVTAMSVKDLTDEVNKNSDAYKNLAPDAKAAVDQYNAFNDIIPQAKNALAGMQAAADANKQSLAALGYTMTDGETRANQYGLSVQAAAKSLTDATAGSTYLENATDKASITAGQGVQSWKSLQAAVATAGQAYGQAAQGVATAEHGVTTASQAVQAAMHGEQQAAQAVQTALHGEQQARIATQQSQVAYTNAVYQEAQAQQAVTAARAAAEQQLISLQLQGKSAADSVDSANLSLFQATQAAAQVGVSPDSAQAMASGPITALNEKQVAAAVALINAQDQVASSQNSASQAQTALNTARQQGIDNNTAVLSAEHALVQAHQGVESAAQGVTNAQYAEQQATLAVQSAQYGQQQAALAVGNAEWGLQQAHQAVTQAQNAETAAGTALTTATDNASRSVDQNTLAGAQNRQMLENIFTAYRDATGSEQIAAQATQSVGQQMGFTSSKIGDVLGALNGLNGTNTQFSITGTPSLNPQQLTAVGNQLGLNFAQIEATLPMQRGTGRARAAGGPVDGMVWVGEQGPELVKLAPGSSVLPHANSMQRAHGYAAGGAVGALGMDLPIAAQWGALDAVGQALHALGGPPVRLPAAGAVDMGPYGMASYGGGGGGGGSGLRGDRAANESIVQSIWASMFGWTGAEWAATIPLIMQESGFNNVAQNPTSTAYGTFQFLNSTWGGYGIGKTSDPTAQSIAGGRYIAARYGDPLGALAHERAYNWYGAGGPVGAGGVIGVGEYGPELLRVPGGSSVMPAANASVGASPPKVEVVISFGNGSDGAFAEAFKKMTRTGQIQFAVNGTQVQVR